MRVRLACKSDNENIDKLVDALDLKENLTADLSQFHAARRDDVGIFL